MEYKRNNWTLIICVVAIVLVIIFIPDFLGLDSFFDDGESQQEVVEQPAVAPAKPKAVTKSETSSSENSSEEGMAYFSNVADDVPFEDQQATRPELTWEQVQSPAYQQILINARRTASNLSAAVSTTYENSKYALFNFVTGIDYVMRDAPSRISVNDAMNYLEHLDMEVPRSFVKDGLERNYFSEWEKVSLTKLIGTNRSERFKKMSKPRFHPEITLGTVEIMVQKSYNKVKRSRQDVYDASRMNIDFSIKANDAVKGEVYLDSKKIRDIYFPNVQSGASCVQGSVCNAAGSGIVRVELNSVAVNGIYTVRLYDRDNKIYDKQYSFTKAFRLPNWRAPANQGLIVFSMPATLTSSRAEGIFALHNDYEDGFITSGDDAGFYNY